MALTTRTPSIGAGSVYVCCLLIPSCEASYANHSLPVLLSPTLKRGNKYRNENSTRALKGYIRRTLRGLEEVSAGTRPKTKISGTRMKKDPVAAPNGLIPVSPNLFVPTLVAPTPFSSDPAAPTGTTPADPAPVSSDPAAVNSSQTGSVALNGLENIDPRLWHI